MNANDALTTLWLVKSHWANFVVLDGEKQALQAGAWLDVVGDIELPDVRAALAQLDAEGNEFPPTAGKVREVVLAARLDTAPDWGQALHAVLDSIHRHGTHPEYRLGPDGTRGRRPDLHPAIESTVQALGGWSTIGHSELTDAFRAQFRDLYKLAAERHDREAKRPCPRWCRRRAGRRARTPGGPVMTAIPRAKTPRGGEVGNFEAHVGAAVIPQPESEGGHWRYTGRLPLAEVRPFLVATLDRDADITDDTRFRAACGMAGCVRPDHLEAQR